MREPGCAVGGGPPARRPRRSLLLVAPLAFRVPRVLCGAGLLCVPVGGGPPASRPRRELRSARWLEARPGPAAAHGHRSQAPPRSPPVPSGPSGALHTSGALSLMCAGGRRPSCLLLLVAPRAFRAPRGMSCGPGCFVCPWAAARPRAVRAASLRLDASSRSPARPRHRPRAPQPGPPIPRGALHTSGACVAVNCSARPRHRPPAPRPGPPDPPLVCVFWIGSSLLDRNGASG